MKAYALDLRERVVKFVQVGGSKVEAGRRFSLGRSTVYRYLAAVKTNTLAPKTSWGAWRLSGMDSGCAGRVTGLDGFEIA